MFAQIAPDIYLVQFTDKLDSEYSIDDPGKFLSQKALNRRARYQIPVTQLDLPVNKAYINGIKDLGPVVHSVSKWFNSVSIITDNMDVLETIESLPYVRSVKHIRGLPSQTGLPDKLAIPIEKTGNPGASLPDTSAIADLLRQRT